MIFCQIFNQMCPILLNFRRIWWIFGALWWLLVKFGEFLSNLIQIWYSFGLQGPTLAGFIDNMQSTFVKFGEFLKKLKNFCDIFWILGNFNDFWSNVIIFVVKFNANSSKFGEYLSKLVNLCWFFVKFSDFVSNLVQLCQILKIYLHIWWIFVKFWIILAGFVANMQSNFVKFGEFLQTLMNFCEI